MVLIYVYGCSSCGKTGRNINRAIKYCRDNKINLEIKYSQYDEQNRAEHGQYMLEGNITAQGYPAIVVEGNKVTRLTEWNS